MYPNLERAMQEEGVSARNISEVIYVSLRCAYSRLQGATQITIDEAIAIQEQLFPNRDVKWLFRQQKK